MSDNEEWLNAGAALIAHVTPDPKPLAALLRSGKVVPNDTRYLIAFLLDPPPTNSLGVRLELVEVGSHVVDVRQGPTDAAVESPDAENEGASAGPTGKYTAALVDAFHRAKYLTKQSIDIFGKWINHDI